MKACSTCGCHHREHELSCPHCGAGVVLGRPTAAALLLGLVLAAPGCKGEPGTAEAMYGAACTDSCDVRVDADGDGFAVDEGDCDDDNADIHPDATETAGDGVDSDCDGDDDA